METDCKQSGLEFHPLNQREVRGSFEGGAITSDGGGLLLREVEKADPTGERRVRERDRGRALAGGYPYQALFAHVYAQLQAAPLRC
ncbi:MAG: transposase [Acidobacteriia bacterium]|nr:transposase [Terriglobia bacterium]